MGDAFRAGLVWPRRASAGKRVGAWSTPIRSRACLCPCGGGGFLHRLAGYATNPAARRTRVLLHREQHHVVAGQPLVLPPDHDLPFYQRRDPTYDAYAEELVADAGRPAPSGCWSSTWVPTSATPR